MNDVDVALYRVRSLAVLGLADILVAVVGSNQPQQSVERILTWQCTVFTTLTKVLHLNTTTYFTMLHYIYWKYYCTNKHYTVMHLAVWPRGTRHTGRDTPPDCTSHTGAATSGEGAHWIMNKIVILNSILVRVCTLICLHTDSILLVWMLLSSGTVKPSSWFTHLKLSV